MTAAGAWCQCSCDQGCHSERLCLAEGIPQNSARIAIKYCIWDGLIPPQNSAGDWLAGKQESWQGWRQIWGGHHSPLPSCHQTTSGALCPFWGPQDKKLYSYSFDKHEWSPRGPWKWLHMEQLPRVFTEWGQKAVPEIRVVNQRGRTNDSLWAQLKIRMNCAEKLWNL